MMGLNGKSKENRDKGEQPELLKAIRGEKRPIVQARLQALYLYKSGQVQAYGAIGKQLGYEQHTVGKWFKQYS